MPGGYLHRFDGGQNVWRRDYHRSDLQYFAAVIGAATTVLFNNTVGGDFLCSAAWMSLRCHLAAPGAGTMFITTAGDVNVSTIFYLNAAPNGVGNISLSYPMPLEIKAGYKVKINVLASFVAFGGIVGAQEVS